MIQQDSSGCISFSFCLVMRDCAVSTVYRSGLVKSGLFFSAWENVATGVSESALLRVPALCSPPRLCAAGRTQSSHQQSPCIISATLHPLHPHHSQRKSFKAFFPSSSTKPLYLSNGNKGSRREDENRENSPQRKREWRLSYKILNKEHILDIFCSMTLSKLEKFPCFFYF